MAYALTLASEVILALVFGLLTKDFFMATALTVLSTFVVYNLWDEFFIQINKED